MNVSRCQAGQGIDGDNGAKSIKHKKKCPEIMETVIKNVNSRFFGGD